jgi:photosystem II stability/assembly factor-like uncharacterized protein
VRFPILAAALLIGLSACVGKTDPPSEAPAGVVATAGDGVVLMSWDALPDLIYWIFFRPGDSVSAGETGAIAIKNAVAPRPVTGLLNGTQYAFVMNATQNDSAAGPSSLVVTATPRPAGDTWSIGPVLGTQNLNALAFNGATRFVTVGNQTTIFAGDFNYGSTNPLGITQWFTPNPLPPGFSGDLSAIIYTGSFVALGTNGVVATSLDGQNWTLQHPVSSAGVTGLNGIAFGAVQGIPTYIAVGNGGQIYFTNDLTQEWKLDTSANTASDLTSISLLNQAFFVTGANGTLLVNKGGSAGWEPQSTGTTSTLRSATFMPNAPIGAVSFVAVGDAGAVVTSIEVPIIGTATWNLTVLPGAQDLRSVAVGGATGLRFLAVGQGGAVVFSDDGVQWLVASSPPPSSQDLTSVLFFGGQYLAVGAVGANAVSH